MLLALGADINAEDDGGRTALMIAADGGYDVMVELLLEHGAALQNKAGVPVRAQKNDEIVRVLLAEAAMKTYGAKTIIKTEEGGWFIHERN